MAVVYLMIFTGQFEYYSGFNNAQNTISNVRVPYKATQGMSAIYFLAGFSFYCLMFPEHASHKFSPKVGGLKERLLKSKFWIVVGYFCMFTLFLTLEVFK